MFMNANIITAYTILRCSLGLNIFLHGWVRWYKGRAVFAVDLAREFEGTPLSNPLVKQFGLLLPIVETLLGMLLMFGWLTLPVIIAGSLLMLLLVTGKSLKADWQTVSLQMIYILLYAVLAAGLSFNKVSADFFLS